MRKLTAILCLTIAVLMGSGFLLIAPISAETGTLQTSITSSGKYELRE